MGDRCLVLMEDKERQIGGIHLPDTAIDDTYTGVVIDTGNDWSIPCVKQGTKVRVTRRGGTKLSIGGRDATLYHSMDIIAIVNEE